MKTAHLTSVHHARDTRILYKECSSLAEAGHEVYLVVYGDSFEYHGVKVVGLGEKPRNRFLRIARGAKQVVDKGLALDCQVYHLHDPELLPFIPRLKRAGKKVIFDSHEDVPQQLLEKEWLPARRLVSRVYGRLEKHYMRKADAVIGVTPHLVERLAAINPRTVMVTNYPVLTAAVAVPSSAQSGAEAPYLCFVGRVSDIWNHDVIVDVIQNLACVKYVLCGPIDDEDYLAILSKHDKQHKLLYQGVVNQEDRQLLYGKALAGVCWIKPSPNVGGTRGSLGVNKLFEQMAAGIPVICTDFDIWSEIVDRYNCGICVSSGDRKGFRDTVQFLLENREQAQIMGKNGRRAVEEVYNWATQSAILTGLYQGLAEGEIP